MASLSDPEIPPPAPTGAAPLARLDRWAERCADWLLSGRAFVAAVVGYLALHLLLRLALLPGGSDADSALLLFSQSFALGYEAANPPLTTWIVIGAQSLLGVSLASVLLPKFALLALFFLLLYGAAREATSDARYAVAAALSPLLLYTVAWELLRGFNHSALLIAACAATLLLVLRLARSRALIWYLLLGLALGVGLQAKYGFALFALALFLAGLGDPALRARLLSPRAAIAGGLALACLLPNLVWLVDNPQAVAAALEGRLGGDPPGDWLTPRLLGLWTTLYGLLQVLMPLLLVLLLLFVRAFRMDAASLVEGAPAERARRAERLLLRFAAILLGLWLLPVVALGVADFGSHLLLVFIPLPLWLFARASRVDRGPRALHRFVVAVLAACVLASGATVASLVLAPLDRDRLAGTHLPYRALAEGLEAAGFSGGTIAVRDEAVTLSGNLRPALPEARIVSSRYADYRPPPAAGQCLVVWLAEGRAPGDPGPGDPEDETATAAGTVEAPLAYGWGRRVALGYRLADAADPACR